MADYIDSDSHRAEVAALNNEIYRLNKRLNDVQQRQLEASVTDPQNPLIILPNTTVTAMTTRKHFRG